MATLYRLTVSVPEQFTTFKFKNRHSTFYIRHSTLDIRPGPFLAGCALHIESSHLCSPVQFLQFQANSNYDSMERNKSEAQANICCLVGVVAVAAAAAVGLRFGLRFGRLLLIITMTTTTAKSAMPIKRHEVAIKLKPQHETPMLPLLLPSPSPLAQLAPPLLAL